MPLRPCQAWKLKRPAVISRFRSVRSCCSCTSRAAPRSGSRSGMAAAAVKSSETPLALMATPVWRMAGVTPPDTSVGWALGRPLARLILNIRPKES